MPIAKHPIDTLIDEQTIETRVKELGKAISIDYKEKNLTVLVVLKGSFVFAADLMRSIDIPLVVEFIGVQSYGDNRDTSGVVKITLDVKHPLKGQDVLIVEDIIDTGLTVSYLMNN